MAKLYVQGKLSGIIGLAASLIKDLFQVMHPSLAPHLHSDCLQIIEELHRCHEEVRPPFPMKT